MLADHINDVNDDEKGGDVDVCIHMMMIKL